MVLFLCHALSSILIRDVGAGKFPQILFANKCVNLVGLPVILIAWGWQRKGVGIVREWGLGNFSAIREIRNRESSHLSTVFSHLPFAWLGMPSPPSKCHFFAAQCHTGTPTPLQSRGGLIFGRNFYRPERNSGVTCRTRQWRGWGRSSQSTLWRALLDTVPLTGSHKSLVWPAHKGWGEYYCRSRRVKLCCGPSQLGGRCVAGPGWCGPIGTLDAFLSLAAC